MRGMRVFTGMRLAFLMTVLTLGIWIPGQAANDVVVTVMGADTPAVVNDTITFTVIVSGAPQTGSFVPTGTVSISVSPSDAGTLSTDTATLDASGRCSFTYTPTNGDYTQHTVTVTYSGDDNYNPGSGSFTQQVIKRKVDLVININPVMTYIHEPVTITVEVRDDTTYGTPITPQGTVSFDDGGKSGDFSPNSVALSNGRCTVTYTPGPGDAGVTSITVFYSGSSQHASAQKTTTLDVSLRPTELAISLNPASAYIYQEVTITVTVEDRTPLGTPVTPGGEVSFSDGGKNGLFYDPADNVISDGQPVSLDAGQYTVTYTPGPGDAGYTTISVSYTDPGGTFASTQGDVTLEVQLLPTEITVEGPTEPLLVYEPGNFTVHVRPVIETGSAPQGTLSVTPSLGTGQISGPSGPSTSGSTSTWTFTYTCTGLGADGGYDTLDIVFQANDGVHAGAEIGFAQAVMRRPTETTLSCTPTETGVSCSVSVADSPDNSGKGTPPSPQGDFIVMVDEDGDGVTEEKDVGDAPQRQLHRRQ